MLKENTCFGEKLTFLLTSLLIIMYYTYSAKAEDHVLIYIIFDDVIRNHGNHCF